MAALSGDAQLGGLFADDRELAEWFGRQLDDDATYTEAALRRSEQIGSLLDRLVQRHRQRRQESINLGLTSVIGAILMSLAAIQSLQYTVPLPPPVKPTVVTALGTVALAASLIVLHIVVPERGWSLTLAQTGIGAVAASFTWVVVSAVGGSRVEAGWTWLFGGIGFLAGMSAAVAFTQLRR